MEKYRQVVAVELANGMKALETGLVTSVIVYVVAGVAKAVLM
jgi:hypothetical protein